ncbi:MAG: AzlD domain-containing protein [Ardenticatenaceae bacterium]|nr:AzlD domain-containing protein [Anaerolineales bacterium]MCB8920136.1 AzlD domain-containing protein [Ardenticatenaceae bacterium]MCB8992198.1 AzlD domain-containing protein [Ardenticatenaceae bacterium]MCB9005071.1 AzlD domain-containing protein [Ardenticatenaceae bacterium]
MTFWLTIIGMGLITYAIRVTLFLLLERVKLAPSVQRGLRYVPTAVLSAIIVPEVLQPGGTLNISLGNARLLAAIVAAIVAWRTRNVLWTIAAGMVVLWLLNWLG